MLGFRFKRQHPIAYYIVDFYCHKAKLVIELDGSYHNRAAQKIYDESRTEELRAFGLTVLRFSDEDVKNQINDVLKSISNHLNEPAALPSDSLKGEPPPHAHNDRCF